MSAIMVFPDPIGTFTSGRQDVLATVLCDAQADLPGADDFSGFHLIIGTKAEVMDGTLWRMKSDGTWEQQPSPTTTQLDLSGYYTTAATDAAIAAAIASHDLGEQGGANEDLNDKTAPGHWYYSAANAGTLANRPLGTQSGSIGVTNFPIYSNNRVIQVAIYNVISGVAQNRIFWRIYSSNGWFANWKEFTSTDVV